LIEGYLSTCIPRKFARSKERERERRKGGGEQDRTGTTKQSRVGRGKYYSSVNFRILRASKDKNRKESGENMTKNRWPGTQARRIKGWTTYRVALPLDVLPATADLTQFEEPSSEERRKTFNTTLEKTRKLRRKTKTIAILFMVLAWLKQRNCHTYYCTAVSCYSDLFFFNPSVRQPQD